MYAKIIAIDYDGTIALNSYPHAGNPNWPVIEKAKAEQAAGAKLVLWTCREGAELDIALEACAGWGLTFDAVNDNLPQMKEAWANNPRKVFANEYWDDHAVEVCANPIEEFMDKAKDRGRFRELEHALTKEYGDNAELRVSLANMQMMKEKYQLALIDVIGALEKHGLVC